MASQRDSDEDGSGRPCLVSTLGMFIMDQFRFEDEVTGENLGDRGLGSQIGGGGTYFAIGARMWLPPSAVLMTVDRGSDFTPKEQEKMDVYAQSNGRKGHQLWRYRDRKEQTTRAVNIYRGQERGFAYLTPKLRLEPKDLLSETFTTFPLFIHCICSPARAKEICNQIDNHKEQWYNARRPRIVWEPIPDSATPENLEACLQVMRRIDVLSPNHEEAASFLSFEKSKMMATDSRAFIKEHLLDTFFAKVDRAPVICIRSGALGALVALSKAEAVWVEAYHGAEEVDKVVDVTGAGNAWLGGFTAGLAMVEQQHAAPTQGGEGRSWTLEQIRRAAQMGSVSASYVVEQQSLPSLSLNSQGGEIWNNDGVSSRLERLQNR